MRPEIIIFFLITITVPQQAGPRKIANQFSFIERATQTLVSGSTSTEVQVTQDRLLHWHLSMFHLYLILISRRNLHQELTSQRLSTNGWSLTFTNSTRRWKNLKTNLMWIKMKWGTWSPRKRRKLGWTPKKRLMKRTKMCRKESSVLPKFLSGCWTWTLSTRSPRTSGFPRSQFSEFYCFQVLGRSVGRVQRRWWESFAPVEVQLWGGKEPRNHISLLESQVWGQLRENLWLILTAQV